MRATGIGFIADQAAGLRKAVRMAQDAVSPGVARERLVAVVSGKGGVGKTNVAVNLAVSVAGLGARVLLVDGDLGLANVDVLLGLAPAHSLLDVLRGDVAFDDALVRGPRGVAILPAASGRSDVAALGAHGVSRITTLVERAAEAYDLVLLDAGAGIGRAVIGLAASCRRALIVTNPEPTSLADAYAMLKVLSQDVPELLPELLVNGVSGELEARSVFRRMDLLAERFLDVRPTLRGFVPHDPAVARAVARQRAVVEAFPTSPAARSLTGIGEGLWRDAREGQRRVRPMQRACAADPERTARGSCVQREGEGR